MHSASSAETLLDPKLDSNKRLPFCPIAVRVNAKQFSSDRLLRYRTDGSRMLAPHGLRSNAFPHNWQVPFRKWADSDKLLSTQGPTFSACNVFNEIAPADSRIL
jgi:hypothetical protein